MKKRKCLHIPLPDGMTDTEALSLLMAAAISHRERLFRLADDVETVSRAKEEWRQFLPLQFMLTHEGILHGIA